MSKTSRKDQRLARLAALVGAHEVLRLRDAAQLLGVSEMTVRRDMTEGETALQCLGGYIISSQPQSSGSDYVLDREKDSHAAAKDLTCLAASQLIEAHDTVFIDCGTTTPYLAQRIPQNSHITVVCYSLNIAEILASRTDVRLIVLGGLYHPEAASFSGAEGIATLKQINLNKAFLSAGGFDEQHGVTCSHFHEVPIKQMVLQQAMKKYLVIDGSKHGKVRAACFASGEEFDAIISR
ncbi:DeoR/GlpR family DNA-binding transcription regulator [Castellaniella sp.]|uniref:DeoR/GlpR family DNA-binding transcription regulator n=1 Tax=Castellaniella sp. TaxID=1955812 RepID=UPI002AFEC8EC|nr:DeoR/GlpR family DNA-binding transcription regulator [Castellaniella sp.]